MNKLIKPFILLPLIFSLVFIIFLFVSLGRGEEGLMGMGFIFAFISLPTSMLISSISFTLYKGDVPFFIQLAETYISGLLNCFTLGLIINLLIRFFKKMYNVNNSDF